MKTEYCIGNGFELLSAFCNSDGGSEKCSYAEMCLINHASAFEVNDVVLLKGKNWSLKAHLNKLSAQRTPFLFFINSIVCKNIL